MPFKKLEKPNYPPRLWALVGYPSSGKSTFSTQMHAPLLTIDADHRFSEVSDLVSGDVFSLSDNPADNVDPEQINKLLNQNMKDMKGDNRVGTIVVDSLTAILSPLVMEAMLQHEAGDTLIGAYKKKAMYMRLLQDAISRWGTDVLWIYHLQDSVNDAAVQITRYSISQTEQDRLYRCLNMELRVLKNDDNTKRGIHIVWSRKGRNDITLWDDSGCWENMPERIEQAVYDGLSEDDRNEMARLPQSFPNQNAAIDWGMQTGVFRDLKHAQNSLAKLKRSHPQLGEETVPLYDLWKIDVMERLDEQQNERLGDDIAHSISAHSISASSTTTTSTTHIDSNSSVVSIPTFKTSKQLIDTLMSEFEHSQSEVRFNLTAMGVTRIPGGGGQPVQNIYSQYHETYDDVVL